MRDVSSCISLPYITGYFVNISIEKTISYRV